MKVKNHGGNPLSIDSIQAHDFLTNSRPKRNIDPKWHRGTPDFQSYYRFYNSIGHIEGLYEIDRIRMLYQQMRHLEVTYGPDASSYQSLLGVQTTTAAPTTTTVPPPPPTTPAPTPDPLEHAQRIYLCNPKDPLCKPQIVYLPTGAVPVLCDPRHNPACRPKTEEEIKAAAPPPSPAPPAPKKTVPPPPPPAATAKGMEYDCDPYWDPDCLIDHPPHPIQETSAPDAPAEEKVVKEEVAKAVESVATAAIEKPLNPYFDPYDFKRDLFDPLSYADPAPEQERNWTPLSPPCLNSTSVVSMSDKSELKAELERKKQRIAQIREEKKRKEEEKKKKDGDSKRGVEAGGGSSGGHEDSDLERKRREAEALLQSVGITPDMPHVPAPMSPSNKSVGSDAGSQDSGDGNAGPRTLHWDPDPSTLQLHSDSELMGRGAVRLGMSKVTQVEFVPKEMVSYSKETQTPTEALAHTDQKAEEEEDEEITPPPTAEDNQEEKEEQGEQQDEDTPKELTEEEKLQVLHSEEFVSFFERGSRIVERALAEQVDVCFDYSGRDLEDKEGDLQAGAKLVLNRQFAEERWTKNRVVTCLDWSPQYPELLVASYNNNEDAPHEPDGVALVWNMKYKKGTPEYIFHCQSEVMSAGFAKFHPNLVVGGTYSGQIVLWDNRSNKRTPVQRTPLSAAAHTHPVYCVNVVGTQNANNLISISTDGKMCSWSLDMLSQPQDSLELVFKQSKPVAVTSMAFPLGDVNNFVVGSEDGSVYTACRHGSKAGITEVFEGHHGPVTGLSCHSAGGPVDFSHLFISSSFDWTVKLWSTKSTRPLYSFEDSCDYVYDAMWSPTHPALFACVDLAGRLDLWNLNNDTEVPTASVYVEGAPALNRVRWAHSGKEIATGDSEGQVQVYDVGEQICVPKADEWTRFVRTLAEINENRDEAEELANA
ncbi:Cytoplasmic dynein 1 intermediate chain 2 [Scomber scombrus]|uniref:Cytoplasmic dynein 1 intermediate chain 2 n=1 Tax=Scomber scombrus TaxID=13677 RepID=A0AAV1N002_SCOSC